MSKDPVRLCGHPRTPENTRGKSQCRICYNNYMRVWQKDNYRRRYLAQQLPATEHKLAMLRREAARLGMQDLLSERHA